MYKITVVLLTWQRIGKLKDMLRSLSKQTYKDFDIHISNANPDRVGTINKYIDFHGKGLNISVSQDDNSRYAFRRFTVARDLAKSGTEIVLFLDDDVDISNRYIEMCIDRYEKNSYKSVYAWTFHEPENGYYAGRKRVKDTKTKVHYCGTGASMVDAKIFLVDDFFNIPEEAIKIEDLWLSYYASHHLGWKLEWMNLPGVNIGGHDSVALNRMVMGDDYNKDHLLKHLIKSGWNV